jgi:hypothetical protein
MSGNRTITGRTFMSESRTIAGKKNIQSRSRTVADRINVREYFQQNILYIGLELWNKSSRSYIYVRN